MESEEYLHMKILELKAIFSMHFPSLFIDCIVGKGRGMRPGTQRHLSILDLSLSVIEDSSLLG
jgi:hypothetical protein